MFDVVCIGNALVDITVKVQDSFISNLDLKKGTMTLSDVSFQNLVSSSISNMNCLLSPGGSSSNVALGVSCLGGASAFIGRIGLDDNGVFFENALNSRGVAPQLLKDETLSTGSAIAFITDDGERTFSTFLGAATFKENDLLTIPETKFLHVEAYLLENVFVKDLIFNLVKDAKARGVKISFDLSDPSLIDRIKPVISEFLKFVDVVFANELEARQFTNDEGLAAAISLSKTCDIAIVKLGEGGSVVVSKDIQEAIDVDVVIPVNTNGAGDAYAAGFLFGLSKGLDLKNSANLASFLARETVLIDEASVKKSLKVNASHFFE